MSSRPLRSNLNQIRDWVRQGRTDAWIAHQLEATVQEIEAFKRENSLSPDDQVNGLSTESSEPTASEEQDLRARDDALIAEELKVESEKLAAQQAESANLLEGTFDHGEEGYGLWLDPAVQDNPIYAEHWAGHRPINVTIEADQIVIKRADK